jgi:hypothetical protein
MVPGYCVAAINGLRLSLCSVAAFESSLVVAAAGSSLMSSAAV